MAVCHLFAIPYTGCGLNPARSLGPAVASLSFDGDHFVYWAGPIVGAVLAASVYHIMYFRSVRNSRKFDHLVGGRDGMVGGMFDHHHTGRCSWSGESSGTYKSVKYQDTH